MDKVLLIDFQNSLYRASVGFGPKKPDPPSDDGWEMYGAPEPEPKPRDDTYVVVFNWFRNLRPIVEQFQPVKCFVVLEGHPQFRYDLFSEYKANRIIKQGSKQEMRDKMMQSKEEIVRLLQYLSITVARAANFEADDTIGSLCENMKDEDLTVLSSDSDFIQLLQRGYAHCQVYNPIKKVFMEAPSHFYLAWKCLAGDKSDNIPKLLSPKKALATVNDPALFQAFMDNNENHANFNCNRSLIEFAHVPEEEIILQEGVQNYQALKQEFAKMDFQSIINERAWEKYTTTFDCLRF